ncbi:MAG: 2-amino-4-hydroxy-6-hydroxymethyldihydropteridine diphosphokinase [Candidatus Eisenbacteria bacterium]|uniref:2-amino-4-hydroxy-6-hydroxymethyldihydropteridine diphosphokinase n=1 Tax=Eiseniibacteriota bacterium TaxID=2212470 RepID=A0A956LZJ5_UNCEI|nr:2-amino-4-hydroxy-6-hydroxymethyldihydropteridine diphosphokinase [Candidatus Eisenbacteria bacterium]
MKHVWIALGSNLGDRADLLARAVALLAEAGVSPLAVSHLYETLPEHGRDEPLYINAVVHAETPLEPRALLQLLQQVERRLGRSPVERSGPRTCDLDLLAVDDLRAEEPDLTLPHPRLHHRPFVLVPLCELDPNWRPPGFRETVSELLAALDTEPGETCLYGCLELAEPVANAYPWRHRAGPCHHDDAQTGAEGGP